MLEQYECHLLNVDGHRWSMLFQAESFGHAEEQCIDALPANDASSIVRIDRDYES